MALTESQSLINPPQMQIFSSANTRVPHVAPARWRRATMPRPRETHSTTFSPIASNSNISSWAMLLPSRVCIHIDQCSKLAGTHWYTVTALLYFYLVYSHLLPAHLPCCLYTVHPSPRMRFHRGGRNANSTEGNTPPTLETALPPHFEDWYSVTLFCQINTMAMCFLHLQQEQEVMGSSPCHSRWFTRSLHAVALYACMGDTARWCSTSHESYTVNFQGYFEICFLSAHRMILYLPEVSCEAVHVFLRGWLVL